MKLTPDFSSLNATTSKSTNPHIIDASTAAARLDVPMDNALLDAEFVRTGRDLTIQADGQRPVVITDYFSHETAPALLSSTGKQIRGEAVNVLAGDPAANQYAGPVEGAGSIGKVEKLAGDVFVKRAGGEELKLQEGDEVYQNDIVRTEGDGSIGITFADGSVFTLGNDARMTLDSLVYDPATGEGSSSVTVIKGMFKFISGDIAANNPGDMVVETPVATIGIRGTTGGGHVIGPGADNQFFLEPNADGTVGWFDVTTDAGTVSMNQPYMNVGVSNINTPPPPPSFITPDAIQQQFGAINHSLPQGRYDNRPDASNDGPNQQPTNEAPTEGEQNTEAAPAATGEGEAGPEEAAAANEEQNNNNNEAPTEEQAAAEAAAQEQNNEQGSEEQAAGDDVPEASELLGQEGQLSGDAPAADGTNPEGGQQAAGEQTAEGSNTEKLKEVDGAGNELALSGDANFDGQQAPDAAPQNAPKAKNKDNPTDNPLDSFINKGTVDQLVNHAPNSAPNNGANGQNGQNANASGQAHKAAGEQQVAHNAKPKSDSGSNDFFQTVQEQIRLGNLPKDALTNPNVANQVRDTLNGSQNPTTQPGNGTTTPPNTGTTDPAPTAPVAPPPTTTAPPPTNGGGGSTTPPAGDGYTNRGILSLQSETINGGAGNDRFVVNDWNKYTNTGSTADLINAGTGDDILRLNDHGNFQDSMAANLNTATNGIDTIVFADADLNNDGTADYGTETLYASLSGGNATTSIFTQSDNNTITLSLGQRNTDVSLSQMDGSEHLILHNTGNTVNLNGGLGGAKISLLGSTTLTSSGSGLANINIISGNNSLNFSSSTHTQYFMVHDGTHSILGGAGTDTMIIKGGSNHTLHGGGGSDLFAIQNTSGIYADGGTGNNIFDTVGTSNITLQGGADQDEFIIESGTNVSIDGGNGDNLYEINDSSGARTGNVSITGGNGTDEFNLSGGMANTTNITLNGGDGVNENLYDIRDFYGTAEITLHANNGGADADNVSIENLSGQLHLDYDNTAGGNVDLTFENMQFSDLNLWHVTGTDNLRIQDTFNGGEVYLNDFFNGSQDDYNLILQNHVNYGLLKGESAHEDVRVLSDTQYDNALVQAMISVDFANIALNDILDINGTVFTFVNTAPIGNEIELGANVTDTVNNVQAALSGVPGFVSVVQNTNDATRLDIVFDTSVGANTDLIINFSGANPSGISLLQYDSFTTSLINPYALDANTMGTPQTGAANTFLNITNGTVFDDHITTSGTGNQKIYGNDGHDKLIAAGSNDTLLGGKGNDTLIISSTSISNTTLDGGTGFDTLDLSVFTENLTLNMNNTSANVSGMNHNINLNTFEHVVAGSGHDNITGANGAGVYNIIEGGMGDDTITGGTGDAITTASYESAVNTTDATGIILSLDNANSGTVNAGNTDTGNDFVGGVANIIGTNYNDSITGSVGGINNIFFGGAGDDTLVGGGGNNTLIGGAGNDQIDLSGTGRSIAMIDREAWNDSGSFDTLVSFGIGGATHDILNISAVKHETGHHEKNFFDLVDLGILKISDVGGAAGNNTAVKFNNQTLAEINDATISGGEYNWNHISVDEKGQHLTDTNGGNGNDVINVSGPSISVSGNGGNDILEVNTTFGTVMGGEGNDTFIISDSAKLANTGVMIRGGDGGGDHDYDTLVLNDLTIDFDGAGTGIDINSNIQGIELLDLYGSTITNFGVDDFLNLGAGNSLVIKDSTFNNTGSFNFATGDGWQDLGSTFNLDLPAIELPDINESNYTTYVADNGGTNVYVHINNEVTMT